MNSISCIPSEKLVQVFSALPDWQSRYRKMIVLGDQLAPFPASAKNEEYLVAGCESKVWLLHNMQNGIHHFLIDSDAKIIRGLLAILLIGIQNQSAAFITQFNFVQYLQALGLAQHLSHSRSNGLYHVLIKIKEKITGMPH